MLQERVSELAGTLNGNGVLADARTEDDTIVLRTFNCPFHELAHEHREICDMDTNMMSKVLGSDVSLSSCMLDGHAGCTFVVKPNNVPGNVPLGGHNNGRNGGTLSG